jgi:hypothetical protein
MMQVTYVVEDTALSCMAVDSEFVDVAPQPGDPFLSLLFGFGQLLRPASFHLHPAGLPFLPFLIVRWGFYVVREGPFKLWIPPHSGLDLRQHSFMAVTATVDPHQSGECEEPVIELLAAFQRLKKSWTISFVE